MLHTNVVVKTEGVTKTFGGLLAVDKVSIAAESEKITIIIGPNGSGKTTLINLISGFYKPDEGKIFLKGKDITGLPPYKINRLGLVRTFQIPQPFSSLTVLENMLVASRKNPGEEFSNALFKGRWIRFEREDVEKAMKILEYLKLDSLWDQPSSKLSGGQLKLLEIGRALMNDADVLLMDEPAAGVNPTLAHDIFNMMKKLTRDKGLTFLIIEHRLDIALQYVDYVYAMARGRVISSGTPEKVVNDPLVLETYLQG